MERWKTESSPGEIEGLLSLAESLDASYRKFVSWSLVLAIAGGVAIFVAFTYVIVSLATKAASQLLLPETLTVIAGVFLLGICSIYFSQLLRARGNREQTAAYRLVGLLHEVINAAGKTQRWSSLSQALYEIRLSRLDIGPRPEHFEKYGGA